MARKPRKDEVWKALAAESGGTLVHDRRGRVRGVRFKADAWVVVLDSYTQSSGKTSQNYTRVRSVFRARDDLRFRIYRSTIFSQLGKRFGMQDLEVGVPGVDEAYIVQSNSVGKVQSLLLLRDVAGPLVVLRAGKLEIRPFRQKGINKAEWMELVYEVSGVIRDANRLRIMVSMLEATIRHLGKNGTASRDAAPFEI
ncbi:MAG: hypothetical protein ACREL7_17130 [Longimicrobiales bacterium]